MEMEGKSEGQKGSEDLTLKKHSQQANDGEDGIPHHLIPGYCSSFVPFSCWGKQLLFIIFLKSLPRLEAGNDSSVVGL